MSWFWVDSDEYQAIERRLDAIAKTLIEQRKIMMATKADVKADLDAIMAEVTATKGAADSAVALLNQVLGQVQNAAASATDLDAFRADLALIMSGTRATEDELKAAVDANPTATA